MSKLIAIVNKFCDLDIHKLFFIANLTTISGKKNNTTFLIDMIMES